MKPKLKNSKIILLGSLCCLALNSLFAQAPAPSSPGAIASLQNLLAVSDTNSLVNASEINTSILYKRDTALSLNGGEFKLDWWVTPQQGAFFGYEEYGNRSAYWTLGYQARTVFKSLEISVGAGTRQNVDDSFGDVRLFVSPALTYRIVHTANWDIRATVGCDVIATSKPNPFVGFTIRTLRF